MRLTGRLFLPFQRILAPASLKLKCFRYCIISTNSIHGLDFTMTHDDTIINQVLGPYLFT
jgi:hypothetical protein